jgi:hypothetical protein
MNRIGRTIIAAIAFGAMGMTGGVANASVKPPAAPAGPVLVVTHMKAVGFNSAVAKAHGYELRTDKAGRKYIARTSGSTGSVTPYDYVEGNCGDSYMWLYADGNHYTTASTGFEGLEAPAVSFEWQIAVVDGAGTAHHTFGPASLAFDDSWHGEWKSWHSVSGYSWAQVTDGWALLADGVICSAEDPWDWVDVY